MKKILISLLITVPLTAFSVEKIDENKPVKVENTESKLLTSLRLGGSYSQTEDRGGDEKYGYRLLLNADIGLRYAFTENIGMNAAIGKWFGGGQVTTEAGSLAYNMSAGLTFAVTGSLINTTTIETRTKKRQTKKGNNHYFISQMEKTTINNKMDGFRVGLHATQFEFSKLNAPAYGFGGSVFYEQKVKKQTMLQYGFKFDSISNTRVSAQLGQLFIGFGFLN